jgi:hypothetical protein
MVWVNVKTKIYNATLLHVHINKIALWPEFTNVCRLSVELVPTFADRGCHVVSVMDLCGPTARNSDHQTTEAAVHIYIYIYIYIYIE